MRVYLAELVVIVAVVLSAGESSRMGRPKALLPIDGQTALGAIALALDESDWLPPAARPPA